MNPDLDAAVAALAAQQHAVVSRSQVLAAGGTDQAIRWRLGTGRWQAPHAGVYVIAGSPATWDQRLTAARLAAGERAVLSHTTAAAAQRLERFGRAGIHLTVPQHLRPRVRVATVHRSRLTPSEITKVGGHPVTSPPRMLLEIATMLSRDRLLLATDEVIRRRLTTYADLSEYLETRCSSAGVRVLREVVRELGPGAGRGDSGAEDRLVAALRRDGLPAPVRNFPVYAGRRRIGTVDLGYPEACIVVEVGADPWHTGARRDRDAAVRNALILDGWLWLEFTDRQVRGSCREAVNQVRTALARRNPALLRA